MFEAGEADPEGRFKELEQHKEMYVPQVPLKFDAHDKLLLYKTDDELYSRRRLFKTAMLIPAFFLYCGVRAIQKRSWWRMLIWALPSLFSTKIIMNAVNMLSVSVTKIYLKSDGETLVLHTALWEGTPRKFVVKVRDLEPHANPKAIFEITHDGLEKPFYEDHMPLSVNGNTLLMWKAGFCIE